jgi:F-type H+-transporting ATPase subunit delta
MSERRVAYRYAKALMELSIEQKAVRTVEKDMRLVEETIEGNESLNDVLNSPVLKSADKEKAMEALFKGSQPLSVQLFKLLSRNKRIGILDVVASEFIALCEKAKGQDIAKVVTPVPLTAELEKKLLKQIESITGGEVSIENTVDESLIGGFILRVGDLEYNASIASKLGNIKRELIQN